jgi:uncharacterized repeat protein (TIGR02543 family)
MRVNFLSLLCLTGCLVICTLPPAPPGPEEAKVELLLKSSAGVNQESLTDTIGKIISIGVILNFTDYIDSTIVTVQNGNTVELSEKTTSKKASVDTVFYPITFPTPGERLVTAVGYISGLPNSIATATIQVKDRPEGRHPPTLNISGSRLVAAGEVVLLQVTAADVDAGQTAHVTVIQKPDAAMLEDDTLRWLTTDADVGIDTLIFIATDNGSPALSTIDTVEITVSATPVNHPPEIKVTGRRVVIAGETMLLTVTGTDSDAGQTAILSITRHPIGANFSDGTFSWTTTSANLGIDTVIFVASDNGNPVMTDTATVTLTVSETLVNNAPFWEMDTLKLSGQPGTSVTQSLGEYCTDTDGDAITFTLLPVAPAGAVITDATWSYTPVATDVGTIFMQIVAADPFGGEETLVIALTVSAQGEDLQKPVMYRINPASDSQTVGAATAQVTVSCSDTGGIAEVQCSLGDAAFTVTPSGDSLYSAMITGLQPSAWNTLRFIGIDNAPATNRCTLYVSLFYDPAAPDTNPPAITLISPSKDTVVGENSCKVTVLCSDASGVAQVTIAGIPAVAEENNRYSATVSSLLPGENTPVTVIATDAAATPHTDSLMVHIRYDNDATGPVIELVTPPNDSVTTSSTSYTITLHCTDESGVASVGAAAGGESYAGVAGTEDTWDITVTGLPDGVYRALVITAVDNSLRTNTTLDTLYIKSEIIHGYSITFDKNDAAATGAMAPQVINSGSSAPLSANAYVKTGWAFSGWATTATGPVEYTDGDNYTMGNSDVTLYAKWIANSYTVSFNKNDAAATGTMPQQNIESGASVSLTSNTFQKPGWSFAGWATSAAGSVAYADKASFTMGNADVILYAQWEANDYAVAFNKNDASATGTMASQTIASGSSAALTANAFQKAGWSFTGWATSASGAVLYTDGASYTMGSGDVILYAKWKANDYTVTFNKNDAAATGAMVDQTIASGSSASLTACSFQKTGWSFSGWATTSSGTVAYVDKANYTMGTGNVTLYAVWTVINHTVTFNKNDAAATGSMAKQTIAEGTTTSLSPNGFTNAGFDFAGWATSATGSAVYANQDNYTMGSADVTLYAKWTPKNLTITFNKNDLNATGTMTSQTIASGSSALLKANAFQKPGWTFAGWATSPSGSVQYLNQASYTMGTSDVTLWAKWTPINYSVSFLSNRLNTTGTMTPQVIPSGSTVNLKANAFAADCMSFMGWATSASGAVVYSNQQSFTMEASDVTLYAVWDYTTVTVTPAQGELINFTQCPAPITVTTTGCVAEYEWHTIWVAMGNLDITVGPGGVDGYGTATITNYIEDQNYYCIITDLSGNKIKSGMWVLSCPGP